MSQVSFSLCSNFLPSDWLWLSGSEQNHLRLFTSYLPASPITQRESLEWTGSVWAPTHPYAQQVGYCDAKLLPGALDTSGDWRHFQKGREYNSRSREGSWVDNNNGPLYHCILKL